MSQVFTSDVSPLTDWSMEQRSRVGASSGVELDAGAEIKVTEFDGDQTVAVDTEDVLRLQVPVGDPLGVEELQGRGNITNNLDGFLLSEEFSAR